MIKFKNVSLKYINDFFSLYNFNMEIESNTLFIGDDFFGSHAIMRILAKIDTKYTGKVFIDESHLNNIKDKDLNIAYVPSKPEIFIHKNLFKNLIFPLKIRKFNKLEAKNIVNDSIFKYNLENFTKNISKASLSEHKLIALIRAIIRKPKYILIEDFFEDLDEKYFDLTHKIINDAKQYSIIIACEKDDKHATNYKDFSIVNLNKNTPIK